MNVFSASRIHKQGFTLVEMMVSIGIFTAITSIAVFNNARFNSSILLTNLAYDVALSIRQAQVYGTTVRQDSNQGFNSAYGVLFKASGELGGSFYVFEDPDKNGFCGTDPEDACSGNDLLETYTFKNGNRISKINIISNSTWTTSDLALSFRRPNPSPFVVAQNSEHSAIMPAIGGIKSQICLSSPDNLHRMVTVEPTGQVAVSIPTSECDQ